MTDSALQNFAELLRATTDEAERARMIARVKMLAMKDAPAEAFEPPIRTLGDYLACEIEVPPVLVEPNIVVRGGLNATIGRAGKGKTVMNLNRMLRWSAGKPLFSGWKGSDGIVQLNPSHPLKILVVENEGAAGLFHRQIGIMLNAEGFLTDEDRKLCKENLLVWGEGGYSGLKLDDPNKLNGLRAGCEKWEPDIVFVEPFRSLWNGEENSATEMNVVVDALIGIATDYECGCIIAHHERKSGAGDDGEKMSAGRGSTVLEGAVTVMENFEGVKGGDFRQLTWSKSRHGKAPNPVRMEWVPEAWWYKHVPESKIGEDILSALRDNADEPMTTSDLMEVTDEKRDKLTKVLRQMADEGKIKKMSSSHGQDGSSGFRWRLPTGEGDDGAIPL